MISISKLIHPLLMMSLWSCYVLLTCCSCWCLAFFGLSALMNEGNLFHNEKPEIILTSLDPLTHEWAVWILDSRSRWLAIYLVFFLYSTSSAVHARGSCSCEGLSLSLSSVLSISTVVYFDIYLCAYIFSANNLKSIPILPAAAGRDSLGGRSYLLTTHRFGSTVRIDPSCGPGALK
jgi:hypothetical protein